jgi:hypothetical protein
LRDLADELVDHLTEFGVAEADTRAWLEAFRRDTDKRQRTAMDSDDDCMQWFPLDEEY